MKKQLFATTSIKTCYRRAWAFACALVLCALLPVAGAYAEPTQNPAKIPQPAATVTPSPTSGTKVTATSSPTLGATETPKPTPATKEDWLAEREETLRHWLSLYGGYEGEALEQRIKDFAIDPEKPMIALTFDDGPMEGITDAIVEILAANNSRATFFVRGSRMYYAPTPGLLKKILGEGNEIGNHTWGHENLSKANGKGIMDTLRRTNEAVFDATGYTIHSMRPPGGYSSQAVKKYALRYDMAVVLWAQSGNVYEEDPEKIVQNVFCQIVNNKALEAGDIVLLHDTKPWMVEAVEMMVPQLLEAGYQLVTVEELLHLSEKGFVYGEVYHKK